MALSRSAAASPRRRDHARATIEAPGGAVRIVAVADTHGQPNPHLDERLDELAPRHILHGGDIGDLAVLRRLEKHAPVTAVRGNIDARVPGVPDVVTVNVVDGERTLLTILLVHVAVYGPRLRADVARLAREEDAALVVCGHSHVPFLGRDGGVTVFNPGSVGPRRFRLPIVLGVIDVTPAEVSVRHVECETGRPWTPGAGAQRAG